MDEAVLSIVALGGAIDNLYGSMRAPLRAALPGAAAKRTFHLKFPGIL
jgi:hypothetical protein